MDHVRKRRDSHASFFTAVMRTKELLRAILVDEHYAHLQEFTCAYYQSICTYDHCAAYEFAQLIAHDNFIYATENEIVYALECAMRYYDTKFEHECARLRRVVLRRYLEAKLRPIFTARAINYALPMPIAEAICDALIVHRV